MNKEDIDNPIERADTLEHLVQTLNSLIEKVNKIELEMKTRCNG